MSETRDTFRTQGSRIPRRAPRHTTEEARREILDAAVAFLWRRPFRDLTVAELMAGTTLSRPAFYRYFADLHALIEALLGEVEDVMHRSANPWIAGEGEPIPALRESLGGVVRTCVDHGPIFRAVAEAAPLDERLERAWSAFMGRWDDAVEARIRSEQREGRVPPLDARRIGSALNALDAAVLIAEFGRRPQGEPEAVLDTLCRIWTATLYGGRGSDSPARERRRRS